MKKLSKMIYYALLILIGLGALYHKAIIDFFRGLSSSDQGLLVSLFNAIATYFKDAEAWNYIFLILFVCASLVCFVLIDIGIAKFSNWLFKGKRSIERVINHPVYVLTVQKSISAATLFLLFVLACNILVIVYGNNNSVVVSSQVPEAKPVLILGTSKMLRSGKGENLYYRYRIDAASDLWNNGKASYFIISGDRSGDHYDETRDMKADLMSAGVPEDKIKLDTAGFRTLDSMLRIRSLYSTKDLIIISQQFHVQRALFLGAFYGMNGTGFYAAGSSTYAMVIREIFGKCKVVLDLILFNMMPRVKVDVGDNMSYREDFTVKSDLHVILLLAVSIAAFSSVGLVIKFLD